MKKSFVVLLLISVLSVSKPANCQEISVASEISAFNVTQHESSIESLTERRWWQSVLNFFTIVGADIGGAYAGVTGTIHVAGAVGLATGGTGVAVVAGVAGVAGAAGASNAAYHGVNRGMPNQIGYGNLNIVLPRAYSGYSLIGRQHNEVIHNNFFLGQSLSNYYEPLLNEEQKRVINSSEMTEVFNFLKDLGLRSTQNNMSFDQLTTELFGKKLMTSVGKEILSAFFEKCRNCSSPKDLESLINFSIEKVNLSILEEREKLSLIAAFMVASESPFYQNPR